MKPRNYRQAAVDAVYDHIRNRDVNPVAVLPTRAGKSLVLAKIASGAVQQRFDLERWDRFDVEIAIAIAGHEEVLEINLHDETLISAQLLSE